MNTTETKITGLDDLSRQQLYELITSLKAHEKPEEITGEKMAKAIYQCIEKAMQGKDFHFARAAQAILELLKLFKNGLKIIDAVKS